MDRIEADAFDRRTGENTALDVAILSLPAYGHVNPTLRTARELTERGHEVSYYLPERFAEVVEPTGAAFERLDDGYDMMSRIRDEKSGLDPATDDATDRRKRLVEFMTENLDRAPELADRVASNGADRVLVDPMCLWGRVVADELDVPTVAFNSSFAMRKGSPLLEEIHSTREGDADARPLPDAMTEALSAAGVDDPDKSDFFIADAECSLVPLTRGFQPDAEAFDDDHLFVGPMVRAGGEQRDADLPLNRIAERPSAYVSLGTVVAGDEGFFETCFDAFASGEWEVVIKAKGDAERLDRESPENVHVRTRVPQLDVLERTDVFVTHGGMNSTMESLSLGTPPIVVPQMADQHAVANRIDALDVGLVLNHDDLTAEVVRKTVEAAATDTYHEAIKEFRASIRAAGGAERAADAIEMVGKSASVDLTPME